MKLGIFSRTYPSADLAEVLAAAKHDGFSCLQFNLASAGLPSMPDALPSEVAVQIGDTVQRSGLEMLAVSGTYNMIHPSTAVRQVGLRRLEVLSSACATLGTQVITLCTGTRDPHDKWTAHPDNDTPEAWRDLIKEITRALELAERYDLTLGIEPELANVVNSAGKARTLLDEFDSHRLKIVFDPANLFEQAAPDERLRIIESAYDLLQEDIILAHAKDRDETGKFVAAGKGVLDFGHYIDLLSRSEAQTPLVLHGLKPGEVPTSLAHIRRFTRQAGA